MQPSFFDQENRLAQLEKLGDPLPRLDSIVDWDEFKPILKMIYQKKRKSNAGRKPWDTVLMFKMLVLQSLYNLSDDQTEYQVRDRLSFHRFLGLNPDDTVPDSKTLWLFREQLAQHGLVEKLFDAFDQQLWYSGFIPKGGQIIDASLVNVPKNRNKRDENKAIKEGNTPEGWDEKPNMKCQKDLDARWTKKHGKSHYGYKNHISIDKQDKLIRRYKVTNAAVHDSQVFDEVLDEENSGRSVWADSAYRSEKQEKQLKEKGYTSRIHYKGTRARALNKREQTANHARSKTRVRVEHVFGDQSNTQGGILVLTKGMARAAVKIGMMNLTYNMRRLRFLLRDQSVQCAGLG
ncbi:IS5 family transposase [Thiolapillus sp.]|uniref:IS5 family transposase n=4 Tax=Thiolapillus sp. TaxID=2017437 RepID=UPI003AF72441